MDEPMVMKHRVEIADPILEKDLILRLLPSLTKEQTDIAPEILDSNVLHVLPILQEEPNLATARREREEPQCAKFSAEKADPTLLKDRTDIELPQCTKFNTDKDRLQLVASRTLMAEPILE
jgi:hypothetical protein